MDNDLREVMKDVPDLYVGPARNAGCGLRGGTDPPTSWWISKGRSATMSSSPLKRLDLLLRILDAVDGPQGAFGESRSGEDVDCRFRVITHSPDDLPVQCKTVAEAGEISPVSRPLLKAVLALEILDEAFL